MNLIYDTLPIMTFKYLSKDTHVNNYIELIITTNNGNVNANTGYLKNTN